MPTTSVSTFPSFIFFSSPHWTKSCTTEASNILLTKDDFDQRRDTEKGRGVKVQRPVAEGEATQVDGLRRCFRPRLSHLALARPAPRERRGHTHHGLSRERNRMPFQSRWCIDDESARGAPRLPALTRPCVAAKDLARNSSPVTGLSRLNQPGSFELILVAFVLLLAVRRAYKTLGLTHQHSDGVSSRSKLFA